jgi:hypothetical protein
MNLRIPILALAFLAPLSLFAASGDGLSSQFNVSEPTLIPGTTLQPGNYSIKIVDHLQDRYLVNVNGMDSKSHALFIAVPSKSIRKAGHPGAISWNSAANGKTALRGFDFGKSGTTLEFVYPKDDAVSLATANGTPVLAVDPASEGKAPQLNQLSNDDMQMVTLWTLTPERVGGEAKISANKYQAAAPAADSTQQVAKAESRPPVAKAMPHTASDLPLILLAGLLSALAAVGLHMRRAARVAA